MQPSDVLSWPMHFPGSASAARVRLEQRTYCRSCLPTTPVHKKSWCAGEDAATLQSVVESEAGLIRCACLRR